MRRRDRPNTWGLWGDFVPVATRQFRLEVSERTLADGTVHTPVDPSEVAAAARTLLDLGAEVLAVVFINSYANPANERVACEAAKAVWPNPHVGHSAELLPEIREFERTSTTALNAYLQPVLANYLGKLEDALAEQVPRVVPHRSVERRRNERCHGEEATNPHRAERSCSWGDRGGRDCSCGRCARCNHR
jgi:N-methylhydantoinase A